MEEVFWSLEEENNTGPGTTSASSPASSQRGEHVIHGSPLWLIAGIAVVLVMVVTPTDWGCWLPLIALAMIVYGSLEYVKRSSFLGTKNNGMLRCSKGPDTAKNAG